MRKLFINILFMALIVASFVEAGNKLFWDFEETEIGKAPDGWKVEATNPMGNPAAWEVVWEFNKGKKTKAIGITKTNDNSGEMFNICWTDSVRFKDGRIEVSFKAVRGIEDQGGGPMWRVKDKDNYYIARVNPLENNFRVYYVKNGARKTLDSARADIPSNQWHTIKIVHKGDHIEGYLNGRKYLDCKDSTFQEVGGVGLWTKADAATYFDDLEVEKY
jgi:hypothetical protein